MSDPAPKTEIRSLLPHDLCKIMPPYTKKEFDELKEDIRKNKLQVPIMTYEGKILDGRGRYNAAVELATFTHGGDRTGKASIDALTQKQAAELLNVSEPSVERAKKVLKNGVPALAEAVRAGKLRVSAVERFAESDQQDKLIAKCKGNVVEAVKKLPKPPPTVKPKS